MPAANKSHSIKNRTAGEFEIRLNSGLYLDLSDPKPDQFQLSDIAVGLSRAVRFVGQSDAPWYVAAHSIACFWEAESAGGWTRTDLSAVLMHDAAEAFICDLPSPLKRMIPKYQEVEDQIKACIGQRWSIQFDGGVADIVRRIDRAMCIHERDYLFDPDGVAWRGENGVDRLSLDLSLVGRMSQNTLRMVFTDIAHSLGITD